MSTGLENVHDVFGGISLLVSLRDSKVSLCFVRNQLNNLAKNHNDSKARNQHKITRHEKGNRMLRITGS